MAITGSIIMAATAGSLGVAVGGSVVRASTMPSAWTIAACDVGQGDAFVVRSGDSVAVIDAGPSARDVDMCLERLGVNHIELIVLTHYDRDHIGGLEAVLRRSTEATRALVGRASRPADERVIKQLNGSGIRHVSGELGQKGVLGTLSWRVLWPANRSDAQPAVGNKGSVTIAFEGDGLRSLFLGDLGEESQDALLAVSTVPKFDVVKVAHHGSADQSERLYRQIGAAVGLISAGRGNRYGHPTDHLLSLLRATGTGVLRTDAVGMIVVAPDDVSLEGPASGNRVPSHIVFWTERPAPEVVGQPGTISLDGSIRETCDRQRHLIETRHCGGDSAGSVEQDSLGFSRFGVGDRVIPCGAGYSPFARFIARRQPQFGGE